jgi:hypothetical protein
MDYTTPNLVLLSGAAYGTCERGGTGAQWGCCNGSSTDEGCDAGSSAHFD